MAFALVLVAVGVVFVSIFLGFVLPLIGKQRNRMIGGGKANMVSATKEMFDTISQDPSDLLRSSWCKRALSKYLTDSCCPIFDNIKKVQGNKEWGSVLDAGTGSHSLDWIIGQKTKKLTAVTGDIRRQRELEEMFTEHIRPQDRIVTGNWKNKEFLEGEVFDVVIADYLIGSIDAFAPYFQDLLLDRLKPHIGGMLYITGAEPYPDKEDDPHASLIIEIAKCRDACILLAGERPYREFPMDWVMRHLRRMGFHIHSVSFFETTYSKDYVSSQIRVAESKLKKIGNSELSDSLASHLKDLRNRVESMKWGIRYSFDYVVAASLHKSEQTQASKNEDALAPGYVSAVQEQKHIFPLDEY